MRWALCMGLVLAVACRATPETAPTPSASGGEPTAVPRVAELNEAELARDSARVSDEDVTHRDLRVRRAAARALARIADQRSTELLIQVLSDEDPDIVAWAAHGLGVACALDEEKIVRALTIRAATWAWQEPEQQRSFDVDRALSQALARCGTRRAEASLRAWLSGPKQRAEAAALALGTLAARRGRLDDASIVALLDAADRPNSALENALLAFGHLERPNASVEQRLLSGAQIALGGKGRRRTAALRALGIAGPSAAPILLEVLTDKKAPVLERTEAARQLARLGQPGQPALATALVALASVKPEDLVSPAFAPLSVTLSGLATAPKEAREALEQLAELKLPDAASPALQRRVVWLRCTAASRLAGSASLSARLVQCDPEERGRQGRLAIVEVLGRGSLERARYRRWKTFASSDDPVVRQAALRLMATHPEIERPHEVLAEALRADSIGVVATAAQILASYPDRATQRDPDERAVQGGGLPEQGATAPHPDIVAGLTHALNRERPPDAVQLRAALLDAAGALQLLSFKPQLGKACQSESPVLRQSAERALRLLGERRRQCSPPAKKTRVSRAPTPKPTRMTLKTDAGDLTIDIETTLAPLAAERVLTLAREGFYDGTMVHRAVPGFVVQFGDPEGDGYGGAGKTPLKCETAPIPFESRSVGVATSGRDTGSSQLFVILGPYPHLDGEYTRLGSASGPWDQVVVGDVIREVTVSKP